MGVNKMSNIIWLNDFMLASEKDKDKKGKLKMGGAETTLNMFIKKGRELGHTIELMTPYNIDMEKIKKSDLVIFSNVHMGANVRQFNMEDIDWIIENKDFVKLEHDATFCEYRNVQCGDFCSFYKCAPQWYKKMFAKAKQVIFLSPLQLKLHLRFFWKELGSEKYINSNRKEINDYGKVWYNHWKDMKNEKVSCIPPCVKKSVMIPSESARKKGIYCVIGAIYSGKGIRDILEQYNALGKNLRFVGSPNEPALVNEIVKAGHTLVPTVPYHKMPSVLQKYEYLILSRRIPETITTPDGKISFLQDEKGNRLYTYLNEGFGRIIPEALNCGLKILVDKDSKKHIGAYSYGESDEEIMEMCDKSDILFWNTLEEKYIKSEEGSLK